MFVLCLLHTVVTYAAQFKVTGLNVAHAGGFFGDHRVVKLRPVDILYPFTAGSDKMMMSGQVGVKQGPLTHDMQLLNNAEFIKGCQGPVHGINGNGGHFLL